LSAESQFSVVSVLSRGSAASLYPISVHSFERQLINETAVVLSINMTSETLTTLSLNISMLLSVGDISEGCIGVEMGIG
jgi:hypothetical protein